jgi:hypothetical protein
MSAYSVLEIDRFVNVALLQRVCNLACIIHEKMIFCFIMFVHRTLWYYFTKSFFHKSVYFNASTSLQTLWNRLLYQQSLTPRICIKLNAWIMQVRFFNASFLGLYNLVKTKNGRYWIDHELFKGSGYRASRSLNPVEGIAVSLRKTMSPLSGF